MSLTSTPIPEDKLSPEQVENWRRVLLTMIGPLALIMSVDEIQHFRDRLQEIADGEATVH